MIPGVALTLAMALFPASHSTADVADPSPMLSEQEDLILVPFQGTWRQGANTFVIANGDTRDGEGFVGGNLVGGNGTVSRYWWRQTGPTTGYFYFDTTQGRQGPVYVELLNGNRRMRWQFGAETMLLDKI